MNSSFEWTHCVIPYRCRRPFCCLSDVHWVALQLTQRVKICQCFFFVRNGWLDVGKEVMKRGRSCHTLGQRPSTEGEVQLRPASKSDLYRRCLVNVKQHPVVWCAITVMTVKNWLKATNVTPLLLPSSGSELKAFLVSLNIRQDQTYDTRKSRTQMNKCLIEYYSHPPLLAFQLFLLVIYNC